MEITMQEIDTLGKIAEATGKSITEFNSYEDLFAAFLETIPTATLLELSKDESPLKEMVNAEVGKRTKATIRQ